jgi:hypothetical protein
MDIQLHMHRPTRYQARWQVHVYSASHLLLSESDCGKCKSAIQTHPNALLLIDIQDIQDETTVIFFSRAVTNLIFSRVYDLRSISASRDARSTILYHRLEYDLHPQRNVALLRKILILWDPSKKRKCRRIFMLTIWTIEHR